MRRISGKRRGVLSGEHAGGGRARVSSLVSPPRAPAGGHAYRARVERVATIMKTKMGHVLRGGYRPAPLEGRRIGRIDIHAATWADKLRVNVHGVREGHVFDGHFAFRAVDP